MLRMTSCIIAVATAFAASASSAATYAPVGITDLEAKELIVKLAPDQKLGATSAEVIDIVEQANAGKATNFAVFSRLSSPTAARWLIRHRLPNDYLAALRNEDPDHPELHLQEYLVLTYATVEYRLAAEQQMKADPAISSIMPNSLHQFSARVNDYFVSQTAPVVWERYQWALEAANAMSPASNPALPSGWDLARGHGYVTVIDTGVQVAHEDLQNNLRLHFSQAFYTPACPNASLTNVDELASSPQCPVVYAGHGTHVAGLIAATPNNTPAATSSIGTAGICWNCSLLIAKVVENLFPAVSSVVNGIYHGIIRGANVLNLSLGAPTYLQQWGYYKCDQVPVGSNGYCDALRLAEYRLVAVVAATGNARQTTLVDFPSSEAKVVGVGATSDFNSLWIEPNRGTNVNTVPPSPLKPDLVAGGKRIVSTIYTGRQWNPECDDALNVSLGTPGVGYDECTGTSMATPIVTGILATARSVNPLLTRADIVSRVQTTGRVTGSGYKMPDAYAAIQNVAATNNSISPMFALVTTGSSSNRFFTSFPQMARSAIGGTMLPTLNQSTTPVYYQPDYNASLTAGYGEFPDMSAAMPPTAYFKVYTRHLVGGVSMLPLHRLSKLQNAGNGLDGCGYPMPVPSKPIPVLHVYTTSDPERTQFMSASYNNCFKYDGIEGYVAPSNTTGTLQQLYRLYNPAADSYILVPSSKVSTANSLGYTQAQTALGWVFPN